MVLWSSSFGADGNLSICLSARIVSNVLETERQGKTSVQSVSVVLILGSIS